MATKLFVGGLSWDTTDANLSAFFAQAGKVVSATVITDRMSGRSKGFGFVEMASDEEAKTAITKLNGQSLDGRTIAVSEARPQAPRGDFNRDRNQGGGPRRPRW
jgi:RNA recognition motif-containing protein